MSGPLVGNRGQLRDFVSRDGDPLPEQQHGSPGSTTARTPAMRWGARALLALNPDPANPNLFGRKDARNSATFLQIADLGRNLPIALQVRYASLETGTGNPVLPFRDVNGVLAPAVGDPDINAVFTFRRGVDPLAPVAQDVERQFGLNSKQDSVPFDIVSCRSLGLDIALEQPTGTLAQALKANIWIEVLAVVVHEVSDRERLPGWFSLYDIPASFAGSNFLSATTTPIVLIPGEQARAQFIIVNTSTNADLWIAFGSTVSIVGLNATIIIPAGGTNRYESPIGGFTGIITGVWNNVAPNGGALVTSGTRKSSFNP